MYSPGTTGQPKGVLLTHRGVISAVFSWLMQGLIAEMLVATEGDTAETRPHHVILIATPCFMSRRPIPIFSLASQLGQNYFYRPNGMRKNVSPVFWVWPRNQQI